MSVFPQALRQLLSEEVYPKLKLWEFFQVNVEKTAEQFLKLLQSGQSGGGVLVVVKGWKADGT